ncbi:hypothetical protein [Brevundimonas sp.]
MNPRLLFARLSLALLLAFAPAAHAGAHTHARAHALSAPDSVSLERR